MLAGGKSRRMGTNKLDLLLEGETLLERTVRIVSLVTDEVYVTGLARGHPVPRGTIALSDAEDDAGPLAGLVAGLRATGSSTALLVACDLPYLEPTVLCYLLSALGSWHAAVPVVDAHPQPACAAYSREVLPAAERLLIRSRWSLGALLDTLRVRWVPQEELEGAGVDAAVFTNVNTPEDWARVLR